ncbi:DUF6392 family protein [Pseudomonas chlororaphis]|uniref:DUF6392 family protein n=1 Tax=Pseudomonas chlororaphis TaxID=587753 RepID=UPI002285CA99|nr:DUF6392 family protein [Pseudomonas chlororaphis]
MWFWAENRRLEQLMITLLPTVGQPIYTGSLPSPFIPEMDQKSVRNALGEPMASQGLNEPLETQDTVSPLP